MDIRTKLALALVSIALLGMLVLGTFAYETASDLLRQVSERQLDALAESKQRDLEKVIEGWEDRVQLIRSRTRLRKLVARLNHVGDEMSTLEIRNILQDAVEAVHNFERLTVFNARGMPLLSVGSSEFDRTLEASVFAEPDPVHYAGTAILADDRVSVRFQTSLQFEDETVGAVEAVIDAEDLLNVSQDYTGLGESGESLVVMAGQGDQRGNALVLTPLRHDPDLRQLGLASGSYLVAALGDRETVFRTGVRDYRGAEISGATRPLPDVDWGLIVKMDRAEESQRADWLREQLIDLGLALGAVAILGGTLLGFRLGKPLRDLKEVVERVRAGERDLRADTTSSDEVGFLAEALNDMLDDQQPK